MHKIRFLPLLALVLGGCALARNPSPPLRTVYQNDFLIGVALSDRQVSEHNNPSGMIAGREFSALTAENAMKWGSLHPEPGHYDFKAADAYFKFARKYNQQVIGHTLVWHSQTPRWVFQNNNGEDVSREELLARMKDHIETVVGRYRGKAKGWDVVNEAISDGPDGLRNSPWRKIIGDDFIDYAFRYAHAADPQAELYYNDYALVKADKRARTITMLKGLLARGVPITGVGMQGHYTLDWPKEDELDSAIQDFAALGLKVMITELDVDVLPSRGDVGVADIARRENGGSKLNPYTQGLPTPVEEQLAQRYNGLFKVFLKHRNDITRVTFWGLSDGQSWLNSFPVWGRTNYPLLWDRQLKPKPAYSAVQSRGNYVTQNPSP